MKYKITVETGDLLGSGTDASVSIKLIGEDGAETSKFCLDKYFHNDFEKGETDTYEVCGDDVGEIVMVSLNNNSIGFECSNWYLAKIVIEKEEGSKKYIFPCYRWVIDQLVVYEGKAILPNSEDNVGPINEQRKKEVSENRKLYKWGTDSRYIQDLPGFIEADDPCLLPKDVQFTDEATQSLLTAGLEAFENLGLSHLWGLWDSWDNLDDFRTLITKAIDSDLPDAAEYWRAVA